MLRWPPPESPAARRALDPFRADPLAYLGEGWGGGCADGVFFEVLHDGWELVGVSGTPLIRRGLSAYRRKASLRGVPRPRRAGDSTGGGNKARCPWTAR